MAAKRSARTPHSESVQPRRVSKHRRKIAAALSHAISVQGATDSAAARWLKIPARRLYAWLSCETPIVAEIVFACPQLSEAFREALCVHEHEALS